MVGGLPFLLAPGHTDRDLGTAKLFAALRW